MRGIYILVGRRAKPAKEDQLRRDLISMLEPSKNEQGSDTNALWSRRTSSTLTRTA